MTRHTQPPAPMRWTPHDLGEFVDHVREDRFLALWLLIATTGIRLDTLLDLRRGDFDMQEARLSARPEAVASRGDTHISVATSYALDPDTYDALRAHVIAWDKQSSGRELRSKYLFAWEDGEPLRPKSVEILFHRHCQKAGLPVVSLQAMRQAYVVAALETGIPTAVISERLGRRVSPTNMGRVPRVDPPDARQRSTSARPSRPSDPDRRRPWPSRSF